MQYCCSWLAFVGELLLLPPKKLSNFIRRISYLLQRRKLLFNSPHTRKPHQHAHRARLIIRSTISHSPKRLLPDDRTRTFRIHVKVACSVLERILDFTRNHRIVSENRSGESVARSGIDEMKSFVEFFVGVDVDAEDGAEEFGGHEGVSRICSLVDCGMDVEAGGIVYDAACEKVEFGVGFGVMNDRGEFVEGTFVDDGVDEGAVVFWGTDAELGSVVLNVGFEFGPDGFGDVDAGAGRAFLSLVFECCAEGVEGCAFDVGGFGYEVEVFAAGFAYYSRVGVEATFCCCFADFTLQLFEHGCRSNKGKSGELGSLQYGVGDEFGVSGQELDDILG